MGTEQRQRQLPSPQVQSWQGCRPSVARVPRRRQRRSQSAPERAVRALQRGRGHSSPAPAAPSQSLGSGSPLLLARSPSSPVTVATAGAAPGSPPWGWPRAPLFSIDSAPAVSQHGLFWGVVLGGGVKYLFCFFFFGSNSTASDAGKGLNAPGGRCRGPTGCFLGSLHSNWLPRPGRGFSRHLCEDS